MDTDVDSFSVLPETKAKEFKISDYEHADRPALFPVHFQFQCLFQTFRTAFQQTFRHPFALRQQYNVICVDHGKEFANHREILQFPNCKVYFADPHAPWQRGTNENFNGLLRQFFPKRTSFADITQDDVDAVANLLNRRPRKSLSWKTPEEVFLHNSLLLT